MTGEGDAERSKVQIQRTNGWWKVLRGTDCCGFYRIREEAEAAAVRIQKEIGEREEPT